MKEQKLENGIKLYYIGVDYKGKGVDWFDGMVEGNMIYTDISMTNILEDGTYITYNKIEIIIKDSKIIGLDIVGDYLPGVFEC